jgi:inner membrane protein
LLGLAVGALRRPDSSRGANERPSATDKAVPLACLLAAELPDLDSLWPASNVVVGALQAHRGPTHALLCAPLVAAVASAVAVAVFRGARLRTVYGYSLAAVLFGHLFADLWTGWGTRLLLPFSDVRLSLDWTMVVDPFVTVPLLIAAVVAWRRRPQWQRPLRVGLVVVLAYLGVRIATQGALHAVVSARYPTAEKVAVFPSWIGPWRWRFVAVSADVYRVGTVTAVGALSEENAVVRTVLAARDPALSVPTVQEAIAWARFPSLEVVPLTDGARRVRVSDLRYHVGGRPTLAFEIDVAPDLTVREARLDRGGSAQELLRRWQGESR